MSNERVIKRYANRRLYDSTGSRHVTLDDIRKMIASGEKVKVVDDKSSEDLTRSVLLQVRNSPSKPAPGAAAKESNEKPAPDKTKEA